MPGHSDLKQSASGYKNQNKNEVLELETQTQTNRKKREANRDNSIAKIGKIDCYKLYQFFKMISCYADEVRFWFTKENLYCEFSDPSRIMVGIFEIEIEESYTETAIRVDLSLLERMLKVDEEGEWGAEVWFSEDEITIHRENKVLSKWITIQTEERLMPEEDLERMRGEWENLENIEYRAKGKIKFKYFGQMIKECKTDVIRIDFGNNLVIHEEGVHDVSIEPQLNILRDQEVESQEYGFYSKTLLSYVAQFSNVVEGDVTIQLKKDIPIRLDLELDELSGFYTMYIAPRVSEVSEEDFGYQ
jgi:hypothetical protein